MIKITLSLYINLYKKLTPDHKNNRGEFACDETGDVFYYM